MTSHNFIYGMTAGGLLFMSGCLCGCYRHAPEPITKVLEVETSGHGDSLHKGPLTQSTNPTKTTSSQSGAADSAALVDTNHLVTRAIEYHEIEPALLTAIQLDDLEQLKAILRRSAELADKGLDVSPLRIAASLGRLEICRYLIEEHHVEVNDFKRRNGFPIITDALGHPKVVRLLIEHGADLETRITWRGASFSGIWVIGDEATALHFAADYGVPETVTLLIDSGVDVFATAHDPIHVNEQQTALEVAAYFGRAGNGMAILNHANFAHADEKRRKDLLSKCVLIAAAEYSNWITWNFAPPGSGEQSDFSPVAAEKRRLIGALLDKGADPNAKNEIGNAIQLAACQFIPDNEKINEELRKLVILLLENGTKIDRPDNDTKIPQDWGHETRSAEMKKALREFNAKQVSPNEAPE